MDGYMFDPHAHFSVWREKRTDWIAGKAVRAERARDRALVMLDEGLSRPAIAKLLNEEGITSLSGKSWSADNVRKLLATHRPKVSPGPEKDSGRHR